MKSYTDKKQFENNFLDENGTIVSNRKTITVKFNDYFTNNAEKLLKTMSETNNKFQDYLKNPNKHNLFMKETDPKEVNKYLNNLYM